MEYVGWRGLASQLIRSRVRASTQISLFEGSSRSSQREGKEHPAQHVTLDPVSKGQQGSLGSLVRVGVGDHIMTNHTNTTCDTPKSFPEDIPWKTNLWRSSE